eukprot:m.119320 g.119320  ORF g.119320 m.119320 type:complete len:170 (-) comp16464_c0_seq8:1576-2085(-)
MLQRHANGTGSALGAEDDLPSSLLIVSSFGCVCVLLLVGHLVRTQVRVLRRLFLPASLLGGLVGLAIVQLLSLDDGLKNVVETGGCSTHHHTPCLGVLGVISCQASIILLLGLVLSNSSVSHDGSLSWHYIWERAPPFKQSKLVSVLDWGLKTTVLLCIFILFPPDGMM